MNLDKKTVTYKSSNSYTTLNNLTKKTVNIWVVFHGIGYLSHYFLKFFKELNPIENYIIAPQAPSKYYLNGEYKYVGASWLTKEDTKLEFFNILNYVDTVFDAEKIPSDKNLILFGFSQGVSIVTRYLAKRKFAFNTLILYAGTIPNELTIKDFEFINHQNSIVKIIYGDSDDYLTENRRKAEKSKIDSLFKNKAEIIIFKGGHEVKPKLLKQFE